MSMPKVSLGRFKKVYDIAVVGGGAAGISAAINARARNKSVVIIEKDEPMGKIRKAKEIRNYPGFAKASGAELASAFLRHAEEMGAEIKKAKVGEISRGKNFLIYTEKESIEARSVILAVGVTSEEKLPGEEELIGRGVSYCVTCDGAAYAGEKVVVISESDEGEEEAEALARDYGCEVTYIPLYEMEGSRERLKVLASKPRSLRATGENVEVELEEQKLLVKGVFLIKQVISPASIMKGLKTAGKHVAVNAEQGTSIEGVFAAGDCTGSPFQIAKAVGQGQIAALSAVKYLAAGEKR